MTDVTVETVEITDMGAQARGNRVFGVKIGGETYLSFETAPDHYDPAVTFCLIGVMEGVRHAGNTGVLMLPHGNTVTTTGDEGVTLDGPGDDPPIVFPDWGSALFAINALAESGVTR